MMYEEIKEITKSIIKRIKKLQAQLVVAKKERSELGHFSDCGEFYQDEVIKIEAKIEELITVKIMTEKYRKKLIWSEKEKEK